jgi:hypothetical protein
MGSARADEIRKSRPYKRKRCQSMVLKTGSIVSHSVALDWGAGKVMLVTPTLATIQFSDGKSRKIASSHFSILQPAEAAPYTPPADLPATAKPARAPRVAKKKKEVPDQAV